MLSPEHARLATHERELVWVEELLDAMESAGWSWADLDLEMFEAFLLDGLCSTIESAPDDPVRVARVLDAFLGFAGREYDAPHAEACCSYLRSDSAVDDIARWVQPVGQPVADLLFAELSAPYSWCDGRCARCPLAPRCPVRLLAGKLAREVRDSGNDEESRAAALATAHAIAANEPLAGAERERGAELPAAARLHHAAWQYGLAVVARCQALAVDAPELGRLPLKADAMLVAVKGRRVAGYLSDAGTLEDEAALADGAPNLLLIERIMAAIDEALAVQSPDSPGAAACRAARDELRGLLAPLLASLPARYRDEIHARVLAGSAPSPFADQASWSQAGSRAP